MNADLGERIKQRRIELGLSQANLAKRAKVSQGTIGQLEVGRNQGSGKILDIAIALGVSPEWLLYGKNPPEMPVTSKNLVDGDLYLSSLQSAIGIKKDFIKSKLGFILFGFYSIS